MKSRRFLNVVPRTAKLWAVAVACSALIIGLVVCYWAGRPGGPMWIALLQGVVAGVFLGLLILALGYVYADARDRGMPPALWTLVALLVPNLLGFLLYFAIRKPLTVACPSCGYAIAGGQVYCSGCGSSLARPLSPA